VPQLPPSIAPAPSAKLVPAAGMFLIARRDLPDPNFHRAVVLIVSHGNDGTLGLVVNRRSHARLADALPDMPGTKGSTHRIFIGGPVLRGQMVMLARNERPREGLAAVMDNLYFAADRNVLELFLKNKKPARDFRLYAGHSGWSPGQLQHELDRGDWHLLPADAEAIFSNDVDLWQRLIDRAAPIRIEVRRRVPFVFARGVDG